MTYYTMILNGVDELSRPVTQHYSEPSILELTGSLIRSSPKFPVTDGRERRDCRSASGCGGTSGVARSLKCNMNRDTRIEEHLRPRHVSVGSTLPRGLIL